MILGDPVRILIVSNTYPPADISGVGTLVQELAQELDRHRFFVRVLTRTAPHGDDFVVATGGKKGLFPALAGWRAWSLLRQGNFDLVHVHESDGILVVLALRFLRWFGLKARLVSTLQVSYRRERQAVRPIRDRGRIVSRPTFDERFFAFVRAPIHALFGRLTARLSDVVVAPSRVTAAELEVDYGARAVKVIANGVSFADLEQAARLEKPDPGRPDHGRPPTVLYVGRLRTRKAVAVLLEAMVLVRRRLPEARLIVVGGGEQLPALRRQVVDLDLGAAVELRGALPRSATVECYASADVYCLPSTYEGFPLAILEAMAAALPIVSTVVSGIPEAVIDRETGLLVPPEDAESLAEALHALLADPQRAQALGREGQRLLAERFGIARITREYLELWQGLLAQGEKIEGKK